MLLSETNPQDNLPKNYFNDMKDVNRKDEVEDETEKKRGKWHREWSDMVE